jgi:hypothetical protein
MRARYRGFFWPAVLIVVGVLALLANAGVISADRLYLLYDLWPLILIVIGLEIFARRAMHGAAADVSAALIVVVALAGAVGYVAWAPGGSLGSHILDLSAPTGSVHQASVEVDVGAATITVSGSSELGADLYRAHMEYSGPKPHVSFDSSTGSLSISQTNAAFPFFENHNFVLNLQLNPGVSWAITNNTAALTSTYRLADLQVRSMEFNTAATHDDITLGTPSGIVPITVNAAAVSLNIHRPGDTATSVTVSGAAVNLDADGRQTHVIGDANWESPNFSSATDGYRVEVNGAACNVVVDVAGQSS